MFGAIVDTGAAASIVSTKFVQQIQPNIKQTISTEQQFRVANGAVTCATACHLIKLTPVAIHSDLTPFIKQQVCVSFFEIPNLSYDLLIGRDLIRYLGLVQGYGTPGINDSNLQMAENLTMKSAGVWAGVSKAGYKDIVPDVNILASTLDASGLPTSYGLNRAIFRRLQNHFQVFCTLDCCASKHNTQCTKYISSCPDVNSQGTNFFSHTKQQLQQDILWINPLWEDADRLVQWLLTDYETPCECLVFLPLWDNEKWFQSLNAISNNIICVPRNKGLFVDPMGVPMPPTNYDLICFHINSNSIKRTMKSVSKFNDSINLSMTKSERLSLRHGPIRSTNIPLFNKYTFPNKQPETRRCDHEDDTSREVPLAPESYSAQRIAQDSGQQPSSTAESHQLLDPSSSRCDLPIFRERTGSKHTDTNSEITLDYDNKLVTHTPQHMQIQNSLLHYYKSFSEHNVPAFKKLRDLCKYYSKCTPLSAMQKFCMDWFDTDKPTVLSAIEYDMVGPISALVVILQALHRDIPSFDQLQVMLWKDESIIEGRIHNLLHDLIHMEVVKPKISTNSDHPMLQDVDQRVFHFFDKQQLRLGEEIRAMSGPNLQKRVQQLVEHELNTPKHGVYGELKRMLEVCRSQPDKLVPMWNNAFEDEDGNVQIGVLFVEPTTSDMINNFYNEESEDIPEVNAIDPIFEPWLRDTLKEFPHIEEEVAYSERVARMYGEEHDVIWKGKPIPFRARPFRLAPAEMDYLDKLLDKYLRLNWIKQSDSPWAAPTFLVPKKTCDPITGAPEFRLVIDYRKLNDQTVKLGFPLPKIDEIFDQLAGAKYFTCLDLQSGYHHVKMSDEARKASAFVCARGHYEFNVLPFGIHSAPPSFQRLMRRMLEVPMREGWCQVYLDDILIFSKCEDDHKQHVKRVLQLLAEANMRIRVDKCNWFQQEVAYLGHIITPDGVRMDPKKTNKIVEFEQPATIKKLMSFMGIINYYGKFLRKVNEVAAPLYELYKCKPTSKGKPVKNPTIIFDESDPKVEQGYPLWGKEQQDAFVKLKQMVKESVVDSLAYPNRDQPYTILTDSSDKAIGGCLEQEGRPVAFYSQKLNDTQQRWSIYEKEAFALHQCLKKWRHLVYNNLPITCKVDNKGVSCLLKQNFTNNKQARWASFLQQFDIKLEFIKGVDNVVADALSRQWPDIDLLDSTDHSIVQECNQLFALDLLAEEVVQEDDDKVSEPNLKYNDEERQLWYSAYRDDPDWGPMVRHLSEGVQLVHKPIERYKQVHWSGGLLLYKDKIVVPFSLRPLLLRKSHDPHMHLGPAKMLYRLANFWWPDIAADVRSHCSHCLRCLRAKGTGKQVSTMPTPHDPPNSPFDRLHFDFVGPLPDVTLNGVKYNHIFSVIDAYSKYVWAVPCRSNITAEETVFLFMTHVVPFTGIPRLVIADGGKQFTSILTKEFARLMEIDLSFTAAYHPESNGVVERWHRDLGAALRIAISAVAGNRDWLQALPAAVLAHNTTYHQALDMSPHKCLFGQEARNPISQLTAIHNLTEILSKPASDRATIIE